MLKIARAEIIFLKIFYALILVDRGFVLCYNENEVILMKTVILNGSPRREGATASIIGYLQDRLPGEIIRVDSYQADISPCIDCRHCMTHPNCALHDQMEQLYRHINEADGIILASPIYFGQLTGSLLSLASRFQYFWTDKDRLSPKKRFGAVVLVDGGMGICEDAFSMGKRLLHLLGVKEVETVYHSGTDNPQRANPLVDEQTIKQLDNTINHAKEFLL